MGDDTTCWIDKVILDSLPRARCAIGEPPIACDLVSVGEPEDDEGVAVRVLPIIHNLAAEVEGVEPAAVVGVAEAIEQNLGASTASLKVRGVSRESGAGGEVVHKATLGDDGRNLIGPELPLPVDPSGERARGGSNGRKPMGQYVVGTVANQPPQIVGESLGVRHGLTSK